VAKKRGGEERKKETSKQTNKKKLNRLEYLAKLKHGCGKRKELHQLLGEKNWEILYDVCCK